MTVALQREALPRSQMKERLSRLDSIYDDAPIFFITCCTQQRQKTLANAQIQQAFQVFSARAVERDVFVGRYVIMPDHLHFFVYLPESSELSTWIKSLKNALSKTLRAKGTAAPHWQKGYFDHVLRSERSYDEKWAYVRMNPARLSLVEQAEDWPFQGEMMPLPFD
jgi:REP element-mobilizing transposase RayT